MNEQMDCLRYREHLDEWIDGMLSEEMAAQMQAHADRCPDCADEARLARETLDLIHSLEDDIPVPLQAQAAWRSAVRAEAQQVRRQKPRFSAAIRALGSVAAAFIVLAGCTGVFRMNGMLIPSASAPQAVEFTATSADSAEPAYFAVRTGAPMDSGMGAPASRMMFIASDGAVTEDAMADTEEAAPKTRSLPGEDILPVQTPAPLLVRSVDRTIVTENFDSASQSIRDLTEQYCGYLADDAVTTAENGLRVGQLTAVIPAMEADSFLQMIDHVGNVTYTAEHLEDVSASVRDVQARLESLSIEQQRLNELIAAAADADELARLSMQMEITLNKLDEAQSESAVLQSRLDNVRIAIRLEELFAAASASPTAAPDIANRMGDAFIRSADNMLSFMRDMAVSLMIIAPFLLAVLAAAAIVLIVIWYIRRKKQ